VNADLPVQTIDQDTFGYGPFAEQLAPNLILRSGAPSLIAGIEAPWGAGKTSFLNLTRNALQVHQTPPLVIDYFPWLYSTVDALLLGFCTQLTSQLRAQSPDAYATIGTALTELSQALSPLAQLSEHDAGVLLVNLGIKIAGRVFKGLAKKKTVDLSNARTKVQDAITAYGRPIVIFIDDVDRLAPKEIRLLFQFIKAVAAFNGVAYVVAYDRIPVENALSFGGKLDGREYLKKFIQVPIRLPRISNLLLQRYFKRAVHELASDVTPNLSIPEQASLEECAAIQSILRTLKTPRDVVRSLNLTKMRLSDCRDEIDIKDLFSFVILDIICPEAMELVRSHPGIFLSRFIDHPEFASSAAEDSGVSILAERSELQESKKKLYGSLPADKRESAIELLDMLFPGEGLSPDVRTAASSHGLIKLLYGGGSPLSFSVKEVREFQNGSQRKQIISEKVEAGVLREWIIFASAIEPASTPIDPNDLADSLIEAVLAVPDTDPMRSNHRLIGEYLRELLEFIDVEQRLPFLLHITDQSKNLVISEDLLVRLARETGLWSNGRSYALGENPIPAGWKRTVSLEQIVELERIWLGQVRLAAQEDRLHQQPGLPSILFRWGQFSNNDYSEPRSYIHTFASIHDPLLILSQFPTEMSLEGIEKLVADPARMHAELSRYSSDPELRDMAKGAMQKLQAAATNQETTGTQAT
jgi:hypothetical protein